MKLKKIISLGLATMLLATPTCTTWAHEYEAPTMDNSVSLVSPRFAYIMDGAILAAVVSITVSVFQESMKSPLYPVK